MPPALKSLLFAVLVWVTAVIAHLTVLVIGAIAAGKGSATNSMVAVLAVSVLIFLGGALPVFRGAQRFKASPTATWAVTLLYFGAAAFTCFAAFFTTALAFNR